MEYIVSNLVLIIVAVLGMIIVIISIGTLVGFYFNEKRQKKYEPFLNGEKKSNRDSAKSVNFKTLEFIDNLFKSGVIDFLYWLPTGNMYSVQLSNRVSNLKDSNSTEFRLFKIHAATFSELMLKVAKWHNDNIGKVRNVPTVPFAIPSSASTTSGSTSSSYPKRGRGRPKGSKNKPKIL